MKKLLILSLISLYLPLFCADQSNLTPPAKSYASALTSKHDALVVPTLAKQKAMTPQKKNSWRHVRQRINAHKGPFICSNPDCRCFYQKSELLVNGQCNICKSILKQANVEDTSFNVGLSTVDSAKQIKVKQAQLQHALKMHAQRTALAQRRADALNQRIADNKRLQEQQAATLALLKAQLIEPQKQEPTPAASSWFSSINPLNLFSSLPAQPIPATAAPNIEKRKQRTFYNGDGTVAKLHVNEEKK